MLFRSVVNAENEYETGDDADPFGSEDEGYTSEDVDDFPSPAPTIVVSQHALNVQPHVDT